MSRSKRVVISLISAVVLLLPAVPAADALSAASSFPGGAHALAGVAAAPVSLPHDLGETPPETVATSASWPQLGYDSAHSSYNSQEHCPACLSPVGSPGRRGHPLQ